MRSGIFGIVAMGAVASVVVLGVLRTAFAAAAVSPYAMIPFLIAVGALCLAGLTVRRQPTIAWLAVIVCSATVTIDLATLGREQRFLVGEETWQWLGIAIALSAILSTTASAAYAADPAHRVARWMPAVAAGAVIFVFAISAWALASPDPTTGIEGSSPLGDLGLVTRAFLITTVALTGITALAELRPAARRATRRLEAAGARQRKRDGIAGYTGAWLRAFVEELSPGREQARRAAIAERARLARDLHAVVVPDLRRAIDEAERADSPERLAASLRDALGQVEALMDSRDTVGLDIGGLVPALESLAERTEERSDVRVTIDVIADSGQADSPPRQVEAAALRIATLALDNVVRHAPVAVVRLAVTRRADRVQLSIEDTGPGVPPDVARVSEAGRGLADMATEASLCGASLRSGRGEGGVGTLIAFDWPAT
ncbi:MAG TPA: ATP-binding protein [Candidatus Limnocylindrales bacterium]|nr:ATP-binding protein [Candidatus Limnocylindrales bacterium]